MPPRRQAAAAIALLRARGTWVGSIDMVRAGIGFPSRAVAFANRYGMAEIEARNSRGPGSMVEYRLADAAQLDLQLDAEAPRDRG
jgi:hypothetical protein